MLFAVPTFALQKAYLPLFKFIFVTFSHLFVFLVIQEFSVFVIDSFLSNDMVILDSSLTLIDMCLGSLYRNRGWLNNQYVIVFIGFQGFFQVFIY